MTQRNLPSPSEEARHRTAESIATLVEENLDVLSGMEGLRDYGEAADEAIGASLNIPEIRRLRLAWELFEALLEGEDVDPEAYLLEHLTFESLSVTRAALWQAAS